jgi:uncharacterized repeat protein (TIGR03803 family)
MAASTASSAQTLTSLTSFNGIDGAIPNAGLIADAYGNLFGTTLEGGAYGFGTVFEIVKTTSGYASAPTVLASFSGGDGGAYPRGGLLADANGNLFGTTGGGGTTAYGAVFEILKTTNGYAGIPIVLASFSGDDGAFPVSSLLSDANGNLIGTTEEGGSSNSGTVFEITKTATGYSSTPTVLVSFNGNDGFFPIAGLIADASGNLFGTTVLGGTSNAGTVYEVVKTSSGYASTPTVLANFSTGASNAYPYGGLLADAKGDLFGTSMEGGPYAAGVAFEIPKTTSGYGVPTTLLSFNDADGAFPWASLIADADNNLFGTTAGGGTNSDGTVFEIAFTATGYATAPATVANLDAVNGTNSYGSLIADANGNLFGTASNGGAYGEGTVFEVIGSGFVPPTLFAGTPGSANCAGVSISTLAHTYGGIAHAAASLGYASVADLQNAAATYCGN